MDNPFELVTASKLSAEDAVKLWCDDQRLARVRSKESCFVNGHRGTGKSMLFRVLQYDCQKLLTPDAEPDFLSVYFAVRDSELMTEELELFQDDSQRIILSESHFSLLLLSQLFRLLKRNPSIIGEADRSRFHTLLEDRLRAAYQFCPSEGPELTATYEGRLDQMLDVLEAERTRIVTYVGLRLYIHRAFDGPLFLFDALLGSVATFLRDVADKTLYLLIDDADDLPESHTIVLNTWIARRHTAVVFKVSTMFGYKTYQTKSRSAIQHPHDFVMYDIATRYLADYSEDYVKLLRDITRKRLRAVGIMVEPDCFFPEDAAQALKLKQLAAILEKEYENRYSGRSVRDHVYRHLTSEYLKRHLVPTRSTDSYVYAGFKVLATLSSGMVRDFIICAQKMFDSTARSGADVSFIAPGIQNDVVRHHADLVLEEISNTRQKRACDSTPEDWRMIRHLIDGLANIFKEKMLSDASERRVFSFAFQDELSPDLDRLLDLSVSEGYLLQGFISRKEGTGRRILYVMTRRIAPAFNLDVTAYSGYLSLTVERLRELLRHGPNTATRDSNAQLSLFSEIEVPSLSDAGEEIGDWVLISAEEAGR